MNDRRVRLVVLAEDRQHEVFARRVLLNLGYQARELRFLTAPAGRGSGEAFVRQCYPAELRAIRGRRAYQSVGLLVIVDADDRSVDQRHQQLDAALTTHATEPRTEDDPVAVAVPKRNVETWIHYLQGETVDESQTYPRLDRESDCEPAAKEAVARCRGNRLTDAPDSLRRATAEIRRLLPC